MDPGSFDPCAASARREPHLPGPSVLDDRRYYDVICPDLADNLSGGLSIDQERFVIYSRNLDAVVLLKTVMDPGRCDLAESRIGRKLCKCNRSGLRVRCVNGSHGPGLRVVDLFVRENADVSTNADNLFITFRDGHAADRITLVIALRPGDPEKPVLMVESVRICNSPL